MWLRSEKRESRLRRPDVKPISATTETESKKVIKPQIKSFKTSSTTNASSATTGSSRRNSTGRLGASVGNDTTSEKCNNSKLKTTQQQTVKRLVPKYEKRTRTRNAKVALPSNNKPSHNGKENCWRNAKAGTSSAATVKLAGPENGGIDENNTLNKFGQTLNSEQNITSSSCSCDRPTNLNIQHSNLSKCISECDSTTDYDQDIRNIPSTSNIAIGLNVDDVCTATAATATVSLATAANIIAASTAICNNQSLTNVVNCCVKHDTVIPEVDSTTDLLPVAAAAAAAIDQSFAEQEASASRKQIELPKLILPTSTTIAYHTNASTNERILSTETDVAACAAAVAAAAAIAGSSNHISTAVSFPPTPDLISLFDEEMNKTSTDICAYSDFYPYNNILTQALLSCTEVNTICESSDNSGVTTHTDSSFLSMNQTTIDNLKALTNLQHHTTNFLSGITLPKPPSCSSSGEEESSDNFIHSATSAAQLITSVVPPQIEQPMDAVASVSSDLQLKTDECMEVEEIPDQRHEEIVWDTFDPWVFIKHLPPLTVEMRAKCPALPLKTRSSPEFSLVLDLDETLVHCSLQELSDASFKFPVLFQVNHRFLFVEKIKLNFLWFFFLQFNRILNIQFLYVRDHFSVNS